MKFIKLFETHSQERELDLKYENIFRKFEIELSKDDDSYSKEGLKRSLEKIGNGEVIEKDTYGEKYMYKELLNNDTIIFVVHGSISRPLYTSGYNYEIVLYANNPSTTQIGGGYGTPGIITINHPKLFHYYSPQNTYQNEDIISNVCKEILKNELPKHD